MASSLFRAIAQNRPEWLAQGVLAHALEVEPRLRRFLFGKAGIRGASRRVEEVPKIQREHKVGRWRADLTMALPDRPRVKLELKLAAGLTEAQRRTLVRQKAIVVHPRGRRPEGLGRIECVTWQRLAELAEDRTLRRLLAEADTAVTWQVEAINRHELAHDFEHFLRRRGRDRDWAQMWAFVATVDEKLQQVAPGEYKSGNRAWARGGDEPYYGWWFKLKGQGPTWFWFGFERRQRKRGPRLEFTLSHHGPDEDYPRPIERTVTVLDAGEAAQQVLREARRRMSATRK